jgi:hypothetical protein
MGEEGRAKAAGGRLRSSRWDRIRRRGGLPAAVWKTEPERSLASLREQGTWLHVEQLDQPPRHVRKEPDLQVAWWWHGGARTVLMGGPVVSILATGTVEAPPLRYLEAAHVVIVGLGPPAPGEVRRSREVNLVLDPHFPSWRTRPASPPATPVALARYLGRAVEVRVEGGHQVEQRGMLVHKDTDSPPPRAGRLEAAVVGTQNLVLVLDDLTVAIIHQPCAVKAGKGGSVRMAGDLGRVVLDVATPSPDVHVRRDAVLVVQPV